MHEGIRGTHANGHTMARQIMRAGSYWLTMESDCISYARRCHKCKIYADKKHAPPARHPVVFIALLSKGRLKTSYIRFSSIYSKARGVAVSGSIPGERGVRFAFHFSFCGKARISPRQSVIQFKSITLVLSKSNREGAEMIQLPFHVLPGNLSE